MAQFHDLRKTAERSDFYVGEVLVQCCRDVDLSVTPGWFRA
jgi:hypothetical protein